MVYTANDFKIRRIALKAEKESKNIKKQKLMKQLFFSSIILFLLITISVYITTYADANNIEILNYQVEQGDTLWSIAAKHNHGNKDVREFIYNIKKINGLNSGFISIGQTIEIPIYKHY